jgi:uncharacterized membrane protein (DUF485 family)
VDTNKEKPDKDAFYFDEDRKLMVSLLKEYSRKLIVTCQQIENDEKILESIQLWVLFIYLAGLLSFISIYFPHEIIIATMKISNPLAFLVCLILFVILLLFSREYLYNHYKYYQQKQELLIDRSRAIVVKLERIIRAASQIDEHIETSLVKRIEWDLRIAEAESALEYYELVATRLKRKKKL